MTTKIPKTFWTILHSSTLLVLSLWEHCADQIQTIESFLSHHKQKVRPDFDYLSLLPWWSQLIHSLNAPLPSSAPAPYQLVLGSIGMIGCGDLRFSASVLRIASCNVGFSRRLRCLIKSAFLSILLVYLQLAIFVSKQGANTIVQDWRNFVARRPLASIELAGERPVLERSTIF